MHIYVKPKLSCSELVHKQGISQSNEASEAEKRSP